MHSGASKYNQRPSHIPCDYFTMGRIVIISLFLILFIYEGVNGLNFSASISFDLKRRFVYNKVDKSQLYLHDIARHKKLKIPQFSLGGHADLNIAGIYFTSVKIGTPSKEYVLEIDTGSSLTWVHCTDCINCPTKSQVRAHHFFDPKKSSTTSQVDCTTRVCTLVHEDVGGICLESHCGFYAKYGEGNSISSGYLLTDEMMLTTVTENATKIISSIPITFGCSVNVSKKRIVDGILGLGPGDFSIVSQLASSGEMPWVFSECLRSKGDGGGFLAFGEAKDHTLVYTPLFPSRYYYMIILKNIILNGHVSPIDDGKLGVIIDTGSTLAYLVEDAYHAFISAVNDIASQARIPLLSDRDLCYWIRTSKMKIFPVITFNFVGGLSMTIQPEDYFIRGDVSYLNVWCIGIRKSFKPEVNIFGELVLKDKLIVYDLAANRLGWTDYNCSSPVQMNYDNSKTHRGGGNKKPCITMGQIVLWYIMVLLYTQNNL